MLAHLSRTVVDAGWRVRGSYTLIGYSGATGNVSGPHLHWALKVQGRTNHNKAACALANKLARICYATLRDATSYGEPVVRPNKKLERTAFAIAV